MTIRQVVVKKVKKGYRVYVYDGNRRVARTLKTKDEAKKSASLQRKGLGYKGKEKIRR